MNDIAGGQTESGRYAGFSGFASVKSAAGFQQFRTRGTMNGAIYTASAQQGLVGRIDDGIHFQFRNVCANRLNFHSASPVCVMAILYTEKELISRRHCKIAEKPGPAKQRRLKEPHRRCIFFLRDHAEEREVKMKDLREARSEESAKKMEPAVGFEPTTC